MIQDSMIYFSRQGRRLILLHIYLIHLSPNWNLIVQIGIHKESTHKNIDSKNVLLLNKPQFFKKYTGT